MKILAIRCKNLASLQGEHSVDFTRSPLAEAGLFAITGPTGSGKSTLLDALCLALYNKTPRASSNKLNSRYILRRGTGEGFAEVEFEALNGHRYRSKWIVRKANNAPNGKLQNVAVELYNLTEQKHITDTPGRTFDLIEQLIGLTFEQFTRAVLLAQGQFASFLAANENEKAGILEKLTGTDLFSLISTKIFEKNREEQLKVTRLKDLLGTIVLLTDDQKQERENTKRERQAEADQLAERIDQVGRAIQWWLDRAKIGTEKESAEKALREASQSKEAAAPQIQWLEEWEKAREIEKPMDAHTKAQEQLAASEQGLAALQKEEEEYQSRILSLEGQRERALQYLSDKQAERDRARPQLNQARELDVQIGSLAQQEERARNDRETAQAVLDKVIKELNKNEEERAACLAESSAVQKWLDENAGLKLLAQDFALVEERLGLADRQRNETARLENELGEKHRALAGDQQQLAEAENRRKELSEQQESIFAQAATLRGDLTALDKEQLLDQKKTLEDRDRQLETAKYLWAERHTAHQQLLDLQQRQSDVEREQQKESALLADGQLRLAALDAALGVAREMWERSRLLLAENVENLRAALQDGAPCAVCGSTEHPYAQHLPVHDALLKEQEQLLKTKQLERDTCHHTTAQSEARCRLLTKEQEEMALQKPVLERIFSEKNKAWEAGPLAAEYVPLPDAEKPNWLKLQGEKAQLDLRAVEKSLAECARLENQLSEVHEQSQKIKITLTDLEGDIRVAKAQIENAHIALGDLSAAADQSRHQYAEQIRSLSPYFVQPDWETEWTRQPGAFSEKIRRAASDWNTKQNRLHALDQALIGLDGAVGPLQAQVAEKQQEEARKKEDWAGLDQKIAVLRAQRAGLFGGRAAEEVENALEAAVRNAQAQSDAAARELSERQSALAGLSTKRQLHQDALAKAREQMAELAQAIETWIQRQADETAALWNHDRLREVLSRPLEAIQQKRRELQAVDERLAVAQRALEDVSAKWDRHHAEQPNDTPLEALLEEKARLALLRDQCIGDISNIETAFRQDSESRLLHAEKLAEIQAQEAVAMNWAKLNEDLGSAEGDKFRKIAQGFTLDTLLAYANVHLGQLAKRYRLQRIPDKLELEVVDMDMGDEVRSVFSLSGGETFLVSLALALGLSSLSSSQMHVESLFIDEGFGSLDPETLATAMDALESLQNQGRKIGVISHVQDMTEKILTQVQVRVLSKGRSTVRVVSIE